ncbi:ADP-ribose pyrophosphatase YjhB (NUDIX family) [Mesorhizobium sp. J18]|uniref:NUDIX hydrolase n=1 Tax=Mesorhizobium sp. J18 TaxID=935263 RepID=UPI001199081C|nr:NUDIX domain-containing protein [Mesorhizobium sp. J18]TWG94668.1 ADP-ribose pyrophosphatase YjhB (NUDIX family) [Mesorhizobium sp. J18]
MNPQAIPAVSVALRKGERLLLVRRGREPARGLHAFPGGRIEAGETAEEAVRRELIEETGLEAGALSLLREIDLKAHDGRVFRLRVFSGAYIGGEASPGDDAEHAAWYTVEEMRNLPMTASTLAIAEDILGTQE